MTVPLPSATEPEYGGAGGGFISAAPPHCVDAWVIVNGTCAKGGNPIVDWQSAGTAAWRASIPVPAIGVGVGVGVARAIEIAPKQTTTETAAHA